ncbi:serine hydrolase domain-containing protein [Bacillus sp. T33-2]|uniref:serine hydrolase domain-containing protein n=1 Tax=Bacillus sp. T33-2 TaxID=2054168 RepID=UPI000C791B4B|nr:serine hydrolase domain-containing protein [Bacillus sp. T33-2]PLR99249.1 hypothetical protein CVD19_02745 [Bacillus sp. T33-2]
MKKILKVLAGIICSLIIFSIPAAYLFGSTVHADLKGTKKEKVNQFVAQFAKEKKFNGSVLVLHKGKVLVDESYGYADREQKVPFKNDELFPIGSITKSMTTIAILKLEEEGNLSVDDKVSKYVPEFKYGNKITIHQLLNHSSGLGDYLTMKDYSRPYSDEEILKLINKEPLQSEPGEKYAYVNSDYYLLGKIIEKVSGEEYEAYVQHHVFDKAGMSNTFFMDDQKLDVKGYEEDKLVKNIHPSLLFALGNVISTKDDLATYIEAVESYQLLSKSQTDKMHEPSIETGLAGSYGYGWYVANNHISFKEKLYSHGGSLPGIRSGLMRYEDQDLTVVIFSNMGEAWNYFALGNEIASIVFDKRLWFFQKLQ